MRLLTLPLVLLAPALLGGCQSIALTVAGIGASAGINHALSGIVSRTYTEPYPKVRQAALGSIGRMGMKVDSVEKSAHGEVIRAKARDRDVALELEAISPSTTRVVATAKSGLLYDGATAQEIMQQTTRRL